MIDFKEYLTSKDKLQTKPLINALGDTSEPGPKYPEKPINKGLNWDKTTQLKNKQEPYAASTDAKPPTYSKEGLAYKGQTPAYGDTIKDQEKSMKFKEYSKMQNIKTMVNEIKNDDAQIDQLAWELKSNNLVEKLMEKLKN